MATELGSDHSELVAALSGENWTTVLTAIDEAALYVQRVPVGDAKAEQIANALAGMSDHEKWEIRRAIAQAGGRILSPAFEPALIRLASDDNARVRQAAQQAILRRRDWRNANALGRQHEERINATLDDIEARFGIRGREAVKRASEQIANTFVRELYHEVIKLISPLVTAADRLRTEVSSGMATQAAVTQQVDRIGSQVVHLRAVLNAMREYTAAPPLEFASEPLHEIVEDAAQVARDWKPGMLQPKIRVDISKTYSADVARPRLVQAFTNLLINAMESYDGVPESREPIKVSAEQKDGIVIVMIEDAGGGMSPEVLRDAPTLFATSKLGGTGVGLPIAIKILESEHGGRVTLQSIKGVGTIVTVAIPLHRVRRE